MGRWWESLWCGWVCWVANGVVGDACFASGGVGDDCCATAGDVGAAAGDVTASEEGLVKGGMALWSAGPKDWWCRGVLKFRARLEISACWGKAATPC